MNLPLSHYLPIATTAMSAIFAWTIYQRYLGRGRSGTHLLWWTGGVLVYGMGTFAESYITLLGQNPVIFKFWYIIGALMGGAPLAQGTVWLLLRDRTARMLTYGLIAAIAVPATLTIFSPLNVEVLELALPTGKALGWQWIRLFSPFINTYAVIFLIGGAILSAVRFYKASRKGGQGAALAWDRFIGNAAIAIGATLPGIGGMYSRMGHTEMLYMGEFWGLILIWLGYWFNIRRRPVNRDESPAE